LTQAGRLHTLQTKHNNTNWSVYFCFSPLLSTKMYTELNVPQIFVKLLVLNHVITTLIQAKMFAIFLQSSASCQSISAAQQGSEFVKGKAVPLQAWTGPEGSRKLRLPDFVTTAQDGGRLPALRTGRLYSWYSFLLEAESTPGP